MRPLREIAAEIEADKTWLSVRSGGAHSALKDMQGMGFVTEPFGLDANGYGVIGQFLTHAVGWKGPVARRIREELRIMCGQLRPRRCAI